MDQTVKTNAAFIRCDIIVASFDTTAVIWGHDKNDLRYVVSIQKQNPIKCFGEMKSIEDIVKIHAKNHVYMAIRWNVELQTKSKDSDGNDTLLIPLESIVDVECIKPKNYVR